MDGVLLYGAAFALVAWIMGMGFLLCEEVAPGERWIGFLIGVVINGVILAQAIG